MLVLIFAGYKQKLVTCSPDMYMCTSHLAIEHLSPLFSYTMNNQNWISEEEGYLLPTIARKITYRHFEWMLQSSSGHPDDDWSIHLLLHWCRSQLRSHWNQSGTSCVRGLYVPFSVPSFLPLSPSPSENTHQTPTPCPPDEMNACVCVCVWE